MPNLFNMPDWIPGSGTTASAANPGRFESPYAWDRRFYSEDPYGENTVIWEAKSDQVGTQGDGGFNYRYMPVDPTKLYRYSMWVKRTIAGTQGNIYLGAYGYDINYSTIGIVRLDNGTTDTNAYFFVSSSPPTQTEVPTGVWILMVYHIYPHTYGGTANHADSGLYKADGTKMTPSSTSRDHKFLSNNAYLAPRCYLFYAAASLAEQYYCYPRFEVCDGTEPTIQQLVQYRSFYQTISMGSFGTFTFRGKF
jgi:hypothetical protein